MDVDALFPFSAALPQIFRFLWARCAGDMQDYAVIDIVTASQRRIRWSIAGC